MCIRDSPSSVADVPRAARSKEQAVLSCACDRTVSMKVQASTGSILDDREFRVNIDEVGGIDGNSILPGI